MSWTNAKSDKLNTRNTNFNRSLIVNRNEFSNEVDSFKGIFGTYVDYTAEISSFALYPLKKTYLEIPYDTALGSLKQVLKTSHGTSNVETHEITPKASMFVLGQFKVANKYNNFIDYKGYTTIKAYLPFLGYVDIDVNECVGKWLQFILTVDYYTGKGMYLIGVSDTEINYNTLYNRYPYFQDDTYNIRIISTYETELAIEIPLGSSNISDIKRNMLLGTIKTAASVGFAAYTASLPPPVQTSTSTTTYGKMARGNYKGARMKQVTGGQDTTETVTTTKRAVDNSKPISEAIDGSIDTLNSSYPSGNTDRVNDSGLNAAMSTNIHIIIYRPRILPIYAQYKHIFGEPLGEVKRIGDLFGFTSITSAHIEGTYFNTATQKEKDEISSLLYSGVILPEASTIQFTINNNIYQAIPGQNWAEWLASGYNTGGYTRNNSNGVTSVGGVVLRLNGTPQATSDLIMSGVNYTHKARFLAEEDYYEVDVGTTWEEFIAEYPNSEFSVDITDYRVIYANQTDTYVVDAYGTEQYSYTVLIDGGVYQSVETPVVPDSITLMINGNRYYAPKSDTIENISSLSWREWINSEYNTGGFGIDTAGLVCDANDRPILTKQTKLVKSISYPIGVAYSDDGFEYFSSITFNLGDNTGYYALPNQTWSEWMTTSQNLDADGNSILMIDTVDGLYVAYYSGTTEEYLMYDGKYVEISEEIIDGADYDYYI